jgi:hypothetical protein
MHLAAEHAACAKNMHNGGARRESKSASAERKPTTSITHGRANREKMAGDSLHTFLSPLKITLGLASNLDSL